MTGVGSLFPCSRSEGRLTQQAIAALVVDTFGRVHGNSSVIFGGEDAWGRVSYD